jgi:hypothetical protein
MAIRTSYTTPKGTELPLLNLKGKEYLEVKYRIIWFREEHPDWSIETEVIYFKEDQAYSKATVKDEKGRIITTSHKFETIKGFFDFLEKSETGAIGRALALIGYGTQFCADEFDEGKRLVDSPETKKPNGNVQQRLAVNNEAPVLNSQLKELLDLTVKKNIKPEEMSEIIKGIYDLSAAKELKQFQFVELKNLLSNHSLEEIGQIIVESQGERHFEQEEKAKK